MEDRAISPGTSERGVNTTLRVSNGPSFRRSPSQRPGSALVGSPDAGVPFLNHQNSNTVHHTIVTLVVIKDDRGYGMKVSGDNPVYVQSVKDGGAAERAGLHSGDKIIKVNGTDVTHSTHTDVVDLIKSCVEVELTVQQRISIGTRSPAQILTSTASCVPSMPTASSPTPSLTPKPLQLQNSPATAARDRITAPQPVDVEKLKQLECQRVQTFRLMLEKEQRYVEALKSELAKCVDSSSEQQIARNLMGAERRVRTLQEQLVAITSHTASGNNSGSSSSSSPSSDLPLSGTTPPPPPPLSTLPSRMASSTAACENNFVLRSHSCCTHPNATSNDSPPPLPSRNRNLTSPPLMVSTPISSSPPPLPPRYNFSVSHNDGSGGFPDSNCPSSPLPYHHQRTKSSPDQLNSHSVSLPAEASPSRLVSSESLSDLPLKTSRGGISWDVGSTLPYTTPPGTPPPPYNVNSKCKSRHSPNALVLPSSSPSSQDELDDSTSDNKAVLSPHFQSDRLPNNSFITNSIAQYPIISMEDDDMSDQEMSNLEDHGPFKNFTKLQERNAHLAVFLNYVISNSDPSSLLFYLITNLYKEGKSAEMKKWAYEIHSSFLVPGAPLRLNNVDENIAREIDETLHNDSDKEEELRKVFQKARRKARDEINEQLTDFQQKRTAGLGTLFGPADIQLDECIHDKSKEAKIVEQVLVPKMEPFIEDIENDVVDDRRFATAAAFGTILSKLFGIRSAHFVSLLERCPTFVSKDKTKNKLIYRSKKVTIKGHHFLEHQYYTVTYCNHCQLIIWGIGPQGYQCTNCLLNIHRPCVKVLDENCPGPLQKKDKLKRTVMEKFLPGRCETRRKPASFIIQSEKSKRSSEDKEENGLADAESGDKSSAFNNKNNRVEPVREAAEERLTAVTVPSDAQYNSENENHFVQDVTHNLKYNKSSGASINRSESYKERLHQKRQIREKRKTSDPNLPITNNDVENETPVHHPFSYSTANSGSSSNSNLSTRSLDSPSNSLEAVSNNSRNSCDNTSSSNTSTNATVLTNNISSINRTSAWDSDTEAEQDPPDWTKCVSEEVLRQLSTIEKKRQEVINELFHTERSHVRALKILDQLFYQPMKELQILPSDQINLLFPNLEEMLEIHSQFNNNMKQKKKENPIVQEIGDILLKMFDGAEGEQFQQAAATFCSRQQIALGALKERRKKDPKLNNFLSDAEGNPICRRLQLKDIIPTGMLRLTKYPLLFENLAKYSRFSAEEERSIQRALERSKDILNHVNAAVKEAEDQYRLAEIQKRLDKSLFDKLDHPVTNEFKNLDLTKHKLITEGSLNLRITNRQKLIELHVLLLEDVIILLQKQDEKYVLKFYNTNSSTGERTPILSPVIKVSTALVRPNATDKKALFLVNTSHNGAQIYDLVASTSAEKKTWFRHISEAAEAYKTKDGKHKARTADSSPVTGHELDSNAEPVQQHAKQKSEETKTEESGIQDDNHNVTSNSLNSSAIDTDSPVKKLAGLSGAGKSPGKPRKRVTEPPRLTTEENPLIEPSQVLISQRSVLTAEPVLTPLEKLRRKDELIRNALKEKQQLVADILHVPREEYETIVDLAGEPAFDKEASELVLAAVNQVDQLTAVINECLHVTDEEAIIATSEVHSATQQTQLSKVSRLPNVPVSKVQLIANSISSHLTQLLSLMTERDQERERLRQELQRSREQLHALHEIQQRIEQTNSDNADNNYADKKREELSTKEVSTSSESNNSTTNKES